MSLGYAFQPETTEQLSKCARAKGVALPISLKHSVEVCRYLRHKPLARAIKILEDVIKLKGPVPYVRFTGDLAHKPSMGPGRYPVKPSKFILELLKSVEANARFKGLSVPNLEIIHIHAHQASQPAHYGRQPGRLMKRAHIEVVVAEKSVSSSSKTSKGSSVHHQHSKPKEAKK